VPADIPLHRIGRGADWPMTWRPNLPRVLYSLAADVVYTWDMRAAVLAADRRRPGTTVAVLSNPAEAREFGRWWRSAGKLTGGIDILCASGTLRRRLVEAGVPIEATTVVRPGVDFAAIRTAKKPYRRHMDEAAGTNTGAVFEGLDVPPLLSSVGAQGHVLLTPSPPSRHGGHYYAVWAAAILYQIWPDVRLVIPGVSREQKRLERFARQIYCPEILHFTGERFTPAELLAASDILVVPALGDIPTGWLARAMAAAVPVVASAVPSVTELIADRDNGFLYKPGEVHSLAVRIREAFESTEARRECVERAHGQAFEVFRAQRCVDDHLRVIENVRAGRRAGEGLRDAAA